MNAAKITSHILVLLLWAAAASAQTPPPPGGTSTGIPVTYVQPGFYRFVDTDPAVFWRSGTWITGAVGTTGPLVLSNGEASGYRAISFYVEGDWLEIWWIKSQGNMSVCVDAVCQTFNGSTRPTVPVLQPEYIFIPGGSAFVEIIKANNTTTVLQLEHIEIYKMGDTMPTATPITIYPTPTEIVFLPTATPWTPVPIATYTATPWSRAIAQLADVAQVEIIGAGSYADNTSPQISYDGTWTNATETMAHWQTISTSTDGTAGFRFIGSGFSVYDFLAPSYGDLDVCVNGDCSTLSRAGTYGPAKIHVTGLEYGIHQVELIGAGDWAFDGVYIHAVIDFAAQSVLDPEATPDVDPDNVSQYILVGSTTARIDYSATAGDAASVLLLVGVFMSIVILLGVTLWKR